MSHVPSAAPYSCSRSCSIRWRSLCSSWEAGDHVHWLVLSPNEWDIYGMILNAVKVWNWIWWGCFNVHVCAVYGINGVRKTSNRIKSPHDCDLFFSCMWTLYVLCSQLVYCIHDWRARLMDGCDVSPRLPAPAEMFQRPKSPSSREPARVLEQSWTVHSAGSKWLQRSMRTALGSPKSLNRYSSWSLKIRSLCGARLQQQ